MTPTFSVQGMLGHQFSLSQYGAKKLINLFEAIPDTVKVWCVVLLQRFSVWMYTLYKLGVHEWYSELQQDIDITAKIQYSISLQSCTLKL